MAGRFDQKKPKQPGALEAEQEQEQEQELDKEKQPETTRAQSQMGNAALAALLGRGGMDSAAGDGGGGGAQSVRRRTDSEHGDVDYGGDDDVVDDVPLSLEDLTRSWNPTTKKTDDRPLFVEPMPDDDLPPEDAAWLESARAHRSAGPLPRISTIDALLQPSPQVIAASISGWASATGRWATPSPGYRALSWLVAAGAPLLQAPDARVLPARAAVGALGTCILAAGPAVRAAPSIETGALIEFCLELEGRSHRVDNLVAELAEAAAKLPRAAKLVADRLPATGGRVTPLTPPDPARAALMASLRRLTHWPVLEDGLEPLQAGPRPEADPDDPLGLDAVLTEHTGGPVDPDDGVYRFALQTAERLAAEASRTRIGWSAVACLVDDVAQLWTSSIAPVLRACAGELDAEVDQALKLLLEVARASQKRTYEPRALGNGLRRAARQIDTIRTTGLERLVDVIAGILPGTPHIPAQPGVPRDALTQAREAGAAAEALAWAAALPDGVDTDLARCALLVLTGATPDDVVGPLTALRQRALSSTPSPVATVASILLAHAYLQLGEHAAATALGADIRVVGRARRNGMLVAEGAVISIEAHTARGEPELAAAVRLDAGRLCADLDARGGLTLLARWAAPRDDDDDYAPFFDYPIEAGEPPAE